ncbi:MULTISPECIES: nicotinate-nucleotide--dimethylbenzimidazole phosphoribosyltransferase [Clostridium]|jgi:nicotinate-nucleotide--dimethylbenzimidazole phosphoribosyltransferase|uniref:nicotinate-nucleotide--dimethylbenzimidazole phosphoribosyltransferase n=1 Tax=Clostridium TaxID=1485 RepID=UPI00028804EF|nr:MULTISPECIES: nicotinate-nucleotide--dimethylbenzimidazole phosphoribosyltransferase [Clostridium]MDF2502817.1 nicotinate-nucleotide--dimethylbenzimidazole phosphoribosyltransferase [Clostridium sp.]
MKILAKALENIKPLYNDKTILAKKRLDALAKPIGSLGGLEEIAWRIAGITGNVKNSIKKKNIIIMCADNGIAEEGVSSCPKNLTAIVTENFTKGNSGVCVLSEQEKSDITVVDIGVDYNFKNDDIINKKIAYGTRNMKNGPAMTREQAIRAIETGIEIVDDLVQKGYDIFGTGEMGIGNTSTSSAVLSVLLNIDLEYTCGKGSGLTENMFEKKKEIIKQAIDCNIPDKDDVIDVLSKVGGFDIAGLCGCFLGAAKNRVPIVIDGFIASVAALCAYRLNKDTRDFMFPSHLSMEPGATYIMEELQMKPFLHMDMRLGEGSGCPLAFNIIEASLAIINNMKTFEELKMETDYLVDMR